MEVAGVIGGTVLTDGGLVERSISFASGLVDGPTKRPSFDRSIDATGLIVAPGFVDLQINGAFGLDLVSKPESMWKLGSLLPQHGVTSFLPTFISSPVERIDAAFAAFAQRPTDYSGAQLAGLHLEGPMLNPERRGAHDERNLARPSIPMIQSWTRDAGVALVTMAPELDAALDIVRRLTGRGIVVSAGHTQATSDQARAGFEAGVTMVTHLFNAMAPFAHREPNITGAVLADREIVAGLIVDGIHVDPVAVGAAWQAKGARGIALVTDAVAAMGANESEFNLGSTTLISDESGVRNSEGTLAGSNLTMEQAVKNLVAFTGCSASDALTSASLTPSRVMNLPTQAGLTEGAPADVVILNSQLDVLMTIVAGRLLHVAPGAEVRLP